MTAGISPRDAARPAGRVVAPAEDETEAFDVVQVGYGPAGQVIAALLGPARPPGGGVRATCPSLPSAQGRRRGPRDVLGLVGYDGRTGRFDDVIGQGFVVMAIDADPLSLLDKAQLAFLELIGSRLVQVSSAYQPGPEVVTALRGTYARWFAGRGLPAVMMRPDYYVFGGAAGLEDLPAVIDSLLCQLGPRTEALATAAATAAG